MSKFRRWLYGDMSKKVRIITAVVYGVVAALGYAAIIGLPYEIVHGMRIKVYEFVFTVLCGVVFGGWFNIIVVKKNERN